MKKIKILFLLLSLPFFCYSQLVGLGGQYSQGADGQFVANLSFPTYHESNNLKLLIFSGLEYTTSGGAKMSGLNLKPIQAATYFGDDFYNNNPVTVLAGVDAGYLFDFRNGRKDGIVFTPNLYLDYKVFFVRTGYDFDVSNGRNQFFIRAGIGIGLGTFKILNGTKIR